MTDGKEQPAVTAVEVDRKVAQAVEMVIDSWYGKGQVLLLLYLHSLHHLHPPHHNLHFRVELEVLHCKSGCPSHKVVKTTDFENPMIVTRKSVLCQFPMPR